MHAASAHPAMGSGREQISIFWGCRQGQNEAGLQTVSHDSLRRRLETPVFVGARLGVPLSVGSCLALRAQRFLLMGSATFVLAFPFHKAAQCVHEGDAKSPKFGYK